MHYLKVHLLKHIPNASFSTMQIHPIELLNYKPNDKMHMDLKMEISIFFSLWLQNNDNSVWGKKYHNFYSKFGNLHELYLRSVNITFRALSDFYSFVTEHSELWLIWKLNDMITHGGLQMISWKPHKSALPTQILQEPTANRWSSALVTTVQMCTYT